MTIETLGWIMVIGGSLWSIAALIDHWWDPPGAI